MSDGVDAKTVTVKLPFKEAVRHRVIRRMRRDRDSFGLSRDNYFEHVFDIIRSAHDKENIIVNDNHICIDDFLYNSTPFGLEKFILSNAPKRTSKYMIMSYIYLLISYGKAALWESKSTVEKECDKLIKVVGLEFATLDVDIIDVFDEFFKRSIFVTGLSYGHQVMQLKPVTGRLGVYFGHSKSIRPDKDIEHRRICTEMGLLRPVALSPYNFEEVPTSDIEIERYSQIYDKLGTFSTHIFIVRPRMTIAPGGCKSTPWFNEVSAHKANYSLQLNYNSIPVSFFECRYNRKLEGRREFFQYESAFQEISSFAQREYDAYRKMRRISHELHDTEIPKYMWKDHGIHIEGGLLDIYRVKSYESRSISPAYLRKIKYCDTSNLFDSCGWTFYD